MTDRQEIIQYLQKKKQTKIDKIAEIQKFIDDLDESIRHQKLMIILDNELLEKENMKD